MPESPGFRLPDPRPACPENAVCFESAEIRPRHYGLPWAGWHSWSMESRYDVIIAGGGICGSALGLALARTGRRVALIEGRSLEELGHTGFDGRSYTLTLSSKSLLRSLGIWPDIEIHVQPIMDMVISEGQPGQGASPFALRFDRSECEEGQLGYVVEDRYVRQAVLGRLRDASGIDLVTGARVAGHDVVPGLAAVRLSTGESLDCRLLVGCDGTNSQIARRAGIQRLGWKYSQSNLTCSISHELPHRGVAHQFFTPTGPFAVLPLIGNRSTIYWTESTETAEWVHSRDDEGYLECLRPMLGGLLGDYTLAGDRAIFPLALSIAERFFVERVALIGDAAHVIHPLAGQGLNVGLRDVAALASVLETAVERGEDVGAKTTLARYQEMRRFDACFFGVATDGLNRLYSNKLPVLPVFRQVAIGALNRMPGLKRQFVRMAAGYGEADTERAR